MHKNLLKTNSNNKFVMSQTVDKEDILPLKSGLFILWVKRTNIKNIYVDPHLLQNQWPEYPIFYFGAPSPRPGPGQISHDVLWAIPCQTLSCMAKNCSKSVILTTKVEAPIPTPLSIKAKFGMQVRTHGTLFHAKFHLNQYIIGVYCRPSGTKTILIKFWTLRLLCPSPFTDQGHIWPVKVDQHSMLTYQILIIFSTSKSGGGAT